MRLALRLLAVVLLLAPVLGEPPLTFVRVDKDQLQTAITRYVLPSGVKVDLVGVVHLGEPEYYAALDKELKGYDAVLFEAILDEGGMVDGRRKAAQTIGIEDYEPRFEMRPDPDNPLTAVQMKLCSMLGLAYQPSSMDYSGKNFVHADMTAQQFEKAMKKNKESAMQLFIKLLKRSLAETEAVDPELEDINPLVFLARDPTPGEQMALRRVMARHIGDIEGMAVELQGTTLVSGRNGQAVKVMREQLKKGRKKIAILYGAAHMPDFDLRLKGMGARRTGQKWLAAWKLK